MVDWREGEGIGGGGVGWRVGGGMGGRSWKHHQVSLNRIPMKIRSGIERFDPASLAVVFGLIRASRLMEPVVTFVSAESRWTPLQNSKRGNTHPTGMMWIRAWSDHQTWARRRWEERRMMPIHPTIATAEYTWNDPQPSGTKRAANWSWIALADNRFRCGSIRFDWNESSRLKWWSSSHVWYLIESKNWIKESNQFLSFHETQPVPCLLASCFQKSGLIQINCISSKSQHAADCQN